MKNHSKSEPPKAAGGINMEKENITVNMEWLKKLLENQEEEFILHVEIGGGKEDATEKPVQA